MTKRPRRTSRKKSSTSECGSLILIDGEPIRARAKKDYDTVLQEISDVRQSLTRFQEKDRPAFLSWFHRKFGALLTELRSLHAELQNEEELLFEVQTEVLLGGGDERAAYRRVLRRRRAAKSQKDEEDPWFGENEFGATDEADGDPWDDDDSERAGGDAEPFVPPPRRGTEKTSRLKELYRALVRKLHPDMRGDLSPQQREWWHQVQEAYQAGNERQLEVILSFCEVDERDNSKAATVSIIQRLVKSLRRTLKALRSELATCRRDLAWDFTHQKNLAKVESRVRTELEAEQAVARDRLEQIRSLFSCWEKPSPRSRRRRTHDPLVDLLFGDF